jgi:hypothetical protein
VDLLFHKLGVSVKHLTVLHETLVANSAEYAEENKKIDLLGIEEFGRQLYAGGKVGTTLQRQMILADIFQYIFVGRCYFAAVESPAKMQKFIELIFRTANLLTLQENLSVDAKLRSIVIKNLERAIDKTDFTEPGSERALADLNALKKYKGMILPKVGKDYDNAFDSLLPKRHGLAVELIVYGMLLLKRYGYVVPLLMTQRLIRGGSHLEGSKKISYLAPPDFLLLREKGQTFGIEVGSAKDDQNTKFSVVTSVPLFSVRLGDHRQPQPYRCARCNKWIVYSTFVIRGLIAGTISTEVESVDADRYLEGKLEGVEENDLAFYGNAIDHTGTKQTRRYHYRCVKDQALVQRRVNGETRHATKGIILPVPLVRGLDLLQEEDS